MTVSARSPSFPRAVSARATQNRSSTPWACSSLTVASVAAAVAPRAGACRASTMTNKSRSARRIGGALIGTVFIELDHVGNPGAVRVKDDASTAADHPPVVGHHVVQLEGHLGAGVREAQPVLRRDVRR